MLLTLLSVDIIVRDSPGLALNDCHSACVVFFLMINAYTFPDIPHMELQVIEDSGHVIVDQLSPIYETTELDADGNAVHGVDSTFKHWKSYKYVTHIPPSISNEHKYVGPVSGIFASATYSRQKLFTFTNPVNDQILHTFQLTVVDIDKLKIHNILVAVLGFLFLVLMMISLCCVIKKINYEKAD